MRVLENKERHGYTVLYESDSHYLVLGQKLGSIWPKVLPYCFANLALTLVLNIINGYTAINLAISDRNLAFLTLVVAFLIISRVKMAYARYGKALGFLMVMYRESSELVQKSVVFTSYMTDEASKKWRNEVAYQTCILLRAAMGVIDYEEHYVNVWDLDEFDEKERLDIKNNLYLDAGPSEYGTNAGNHMRWIHRDAIRSEHEENARVPVRLGYLLRKFIYTGRKTLPEAMSNPQEANLIGCVDEIMKGYYGISDFKHTPVPFPVVQMARTFLFFYVFMVPFALLSDACGLVADLIIMFVLTFGLVGLEFVSIELNEPFGEDDNDFDNLGMAYTTFEDIKCTILEADGHEWTERLHSRLNPPHK